MKKILILTLLTVQSVFALDVVDLNATFKKGNDLYHKDKFAEAAKEYEAVLAAGLQSPELHFNLANSYYKLNEIGPAIFHYEKALMLCPHDKDIKSNLAFAQRMMVDEVREDQRVGFQKIVADFTSWFSYNGWAKVAVLMAFLFFAGFVGYYLSSRTLYKRIFFTSMSLVLIGLCVSIASAFAARTLYETERPAIVFQAISGVKAEPKVTAADAFVLHEGTKVYVLEELDNYKKVALADGTDGWIEKSAIKELK